jgi:hypothetical protein
MSSADEPKTPNRAMPLVSTLPTGAGIPSRDMLAIQSRTEFHLDVLTFSDVARYFIEERPAEPGISAGALLRQRRLGAERPKRYLHFFLDDRDRPLPDRHGVPYGRVVQALRMDEELAAAFARHRSDLLIFR